MSLDTLLSWIEGTWWPFVWSATLASSIVLLIVACVWCAIRRFASAHLGYALFLLPLVPFVIPLRGLVPLELPISGVLTRWEPAAASLSAARYESQWVTKRETSDFVVEQPNVVSPLLSEPSAALELVGQPQSGSSASHRVVEPGRAFGWPLCAFAVWLSVVVLLSWRWVQWQYRTQRLARRATPVRDARLRLLVRRTAESAGLRQMPRVVETAELHSPAVCGIWRPTLLLPKGLGDWLADETLVWSLHHEFAHLRRFDLAAGSGQRALQILWWFHPLMWVVNRIVAELRECACDEAASARMPGLSRRRAADALVDLVESARRTGRERLALESLYSQKHSLEKRIMRLIDSRYLCRPGLTPTAALFLALTASVGFASTQFTFVEPEFEDAGIGVLQEPEEPEEIEEEIFEEAEPLEFDEVEPTPADEAQIAIALSLDWIVRQQEEDGHWATGNPNGGMAGEFNDVGVTAIVLDCLRQSSNPDHAQAAKRGFAWLDSVYDEELGLFGKIEGWGFMSGHALATRLWIQSQGGELSGRYLEVAKGAVDFIKRGRNPYGAWRFDYPPTGESDTFVTSLMLRALAAARAAGLQVDARSIEHGLLYLDEMTDKATGRTGYESLGGGPARLAGKGEDFPAKYSEYPTAMAILARIDLGLDPVDSHEIIAGGGLIARLSPVWDPVKGTNDSYYWMYGTQALRNLGGVGWERWRRDLIKALVPNQRIDGTWPLQDAWSGKGDYVHLASVYTRALQEATRK